MRNIRPHLWFDTEAEEAARFYTRVFKSSKLGAISRYPETGQEITGKPPGSVMSVEFELDGHPFVALNGGPDFKFNESISFIIDCTDQAEVDYYWERLTEGGDPSAQQCGWLKDKFGLSWQVIPPGFDEIFANPDKTKVERAFQAMLQMKKLDVAELRRAAEGQTTAPR